MDEVAQEHAVASQIAYTFEDEGYQKAEQELKESYPNYELDKELSDNYSITIIKPDGSAILSYRGTDIDRPDDIMADMVIASGLYKTSILQYVALPSGAYKYLPAGFTRFNLAQQKYESVASKYNKITLTGHSKGGSQAKYIANNNNVEAHIFNPGSVPNLPGEVYESNANTYLVKGDIISKFSSTYTPKEKIKYIPQTASSSHSLQNFLLKSNNNLPKTLTLQGTTFTDKDIIEQMCKEFPELCPKYR